MSYDEKNNELYVALPIIAVLVLAYLIHAIWWGIRWDRLMEQRRQFGSLFDCPHRKEDD